jgi:hypothetical protein
MVKENAATTWATCAEKLETDFAPYFKDSLDFLILQLNTHDGPEFK